MGETNTTNVNWFRDSILVRVLFIGFIILILNMPVSMIHGLVYERQLTRDQAIKDISNKWGGSQLIKAPKLVVPYYTVTRYRDNRGVEQTSRNTHFAIFLPEQLNISGLVTSETRSRGLYEVPLYQSGLVISGSFAKPSFQIWGINEKQVMWDKAELVVDVSDASAIQKRAQLQWNNRTFDFEPGQGQSNTTSPGFHAVLDGKFEADQYQYQIKLSLNGSQRLFFAPFGKDTHIQLKSDWPHPSFQGNKLPNSRQVDEQGFSAEWKLSYISRNYPQQWLTHKFSEAVLESSLLGVDFISPVDNYRMTDRSIKYQTLFLLLTFTIIWLIETIVGVRVHLLQYLLLGLGMCLFYLLLLAISEHLGFAWAYLVAGTAVFGMTMAYSKAVLKTSKRASLVGGSVAVLYIYLYTLLQEQNYSLLFGAIGVFLALAAVMFFTRQIDWYNIRRS